MHVGCLGEREHALDRHFQPALRQSLQAMRHAGVPFGRALVDRAEMQAGEGLRARQDALADVLERLAFGFANADDVSERADHAQALSDEIARITGEATLSATTATSTTQAKAPTIKDVVAALQKSADGAGQLAAQLSGYRAGLLGSIAASCTAAYTVALAAPNEAP